jgi:hypothetical protein
MKSVAEHSQGNVARFTVLSSVIDGIQSVFEIEIRSRVEWQTANAGIQRWLHLFGQISIRDKCFGLSG